MYIIDDIAYAGENTPTIKVKSVRPLEDYKLWLRFSTDEEKIFDFSPLLVMPVFAPLKDKSLFEGVYVDFGVPVWMDGEIDLAPEKLYTEGIAIQDNRSA
jgi:hypothetical protein